MQVRNFILVALAGWAVGFGADLAPWLGVGLQDVNAERAKALKLPEETGVEVTLLFPNAPAAAAGVKLGDVILQYNGQRVEDREQFAEMVRETPIGREAKLQIFRNGASLTVVAKVSSRPPLAMQGGLIATPVHSQPFQGFQQDVPINRMSWGSSVLGAELESLEGQMASYFGVQEGVLVRSIMRGSAAERAGLKAGDVITRVGDAKVAAPADVSGRLRAGRGQSAALALMRDHREMSLTITLDGLGDQ